MAKIRYPGGRLAALGALVLVALLSPVGARAEIKFTSPTPTFDEAVQRARQQGKPLVLEFSASWCGPCKQMARALERPELQDALGRVYWLVIDGSDDPLGSQMMQAVMSGERLAFPTTIAFDGDGKEVMRYSGFSNTRALEAWIRSLPERALTVAELRKSADAAPKDGALQRRVADRLLKAGDRAGARQYLLKAEQAGPPEVAAKAAWQRLRLDFTERSEQSDSQLGQQLVLPVAAKYPTGEQALSAARYLALAPKPQAAQVEAILLKWVAAKQSAADLREAAHVALKAGAGKAAIEIGKKLAEQPKPDAERQDTLAEIAFLAENNVDKAVDLAQKAMAGASEARKQVLSANIERYRRNKHEPAERSGFEAPKLALPNKKKPSTASPPSADAQLLARGKRELVRSVQKDCWKLLGSAAAIESLANLRTAVAKAPTVANLPADFPTLASEILARCGELPLDFAGPLRLCHGDLKISNLLFLDAGAEAPVGHCLVDLDTLCHLQLGLELGDALRSWCNPYDENNPDGRFDLERFTAALTGYAVDGAALVTAEEPQLFLSGTLRVALQLAARFAADVVNQSYFGWDPTRFKDRAEHNFVRARGQLSLARSLSDQRAAAAAVVARLFPAAGRPARLDPPL